MILIYFIYPHTVNSFINQTSTDKDSTDPYLVGTEEYREPWHREEGDITGGDLINHDKIMQYRGYEGVHRPFVTDILAGYDWPITNTIGVQDDTESRAAGDMGSYDMGSYTSADALPSENASFDRASGNKKPVELDLNVIGTPPAIVTANGLDMTRLFPQDGNTALMYSDIDVLKKWDNTNTHTDFEFTSSGQVVDGAPSFTPSHIPRSG